MKLLPRATTRARGRRRRAHRRAAITLPAPVVARCSVRLVAGDALHRAAAARGEIMQPGATANGRRRPPRMVHAREGEQVGPAQGGQRAGRRHRARPAPAIAGWARASGRTSASLRTRLVIGGGLGRGVVARSGAFCAYTRGRPPGTAASALLRVEHVAQAVAQQVEAQADDDDGEARHGGDPPVVEHVLPAGARSWRPIPASGAGRRGRGSPGPRR